MTTQGEHVERGLRAIARAIERGFDQLQIGVLPDIQPIPASNQTLTPDQADDLPEWSVVETTDEVREELTLWAVHNGCYVEIGGDQCVDTLADRGTIRLIHRAGAA